VGGGICGLTCSSAGSSVIASTGSVADVAASSAASGNTLGSSEGGGTCGLTCSSAGSSVIASTGSVADVAASSAAKGNAPGSPLGAASVVLNCVRVLTPVASGTYDPDREKGADAVNRTEIWRGPPTKPLPCTLLVGDGTTLGLIAATVAAAARGGGSSRK
jgi:hypothetical protein